MIFSILFGMFLLILTVGLLLFLGMIVHLWEEKTFKGMNFIDLLRDGFISITVLFLISSIIALFSLAGDSLLEWLKWK